MNHSLQTHTRCQTSCLKVASFSGPAVSESAWCMEWQISFVSAGINRNKAGVNKKNNYYHHMELHMERIIWQQVQESEVKLYKERKHSEELREKLWKRKIRNWSVWNVWGFTEICISVLLLFVLNRNVLFILWCDRIHDVCHLTKNLPCIFLFFMFWCMTMIFLPAVHLCDHMKTINTVFPCWRQYFYLFNICVYVLQQLPLKNTSVETLQ